LEASLKPLFYNLNKDVLAFYREMYTNKKYREISNTLKSKGNDYYMLERIAISIAESLKNGIEGFDNTKFLSKNADHNDLLFAYFKVKQIRL
jgi:hypothetical protein